MFEICLFDLDQTLVDTDDLKEVREAGRNNTSAEYLVSLRREYARKSDRSLYELAMLRKIRRQSPAIRLGIFTRSPRSYAQEVLNLAFPGFTWDIVVAYEDVENTKPYGDGIDKAMHTFGVTRLDRVVLVGDSDIDVRAAYHAGCVSVLDKSNWPRRWLPDHWNALGHLPDAVIDSPDELLSVLADYRPHLPELERLLSGVREHPSSPRVDRINKFIPRAIGGDHTAYPVHACGRSFAGYTSLEWRRRWHQLTQSIHDHKEAREFPEEWITAVRGFFHKEFYAQRIFGGRVGVAVIPGRPNRVPRLEAFLAQLNAAVRAKPIGKLTLEFHPVLLGYRDGVRSNSNEKLKPNERFANVRDHLYVRDPSVVAKGGSFVVIDDVSTTGATLIYAKKYLEAAGATEVKCLTLAMNISNVLYE